MWLAQKYSVIYVERQGLTVFKHHNLKFSWSFPENVVCDLEIVDNHYFERALVEFLRRVLRGRAVVVLSNNMTFFAMIKSRKSMVEKNALIAKFYESIPFKNQDKLRKQVELKGDTYLFSANKKLVDEIVRFFKLSEWKIESVIPETALEIFLPHHTNKNLMLEVNQNKPLLKTANFLSQ